MTQAEIPAGWYADPRGTPDQLRWWDGSKWTTHTHPGRPPEPQGPRSAAGSAAPRRPTTAPAPQVPATPAAQAPPATPQAPPAPAWDHAPAAPSGQAPPPQQHPGGPLFTEPVLIVNQKAKVIEVVNEYTVYDREGRTVGSVAEVGQNLAKKVLRFVSHYDQYLRHKLEVRDAQGRPQLVLTRPAKLLKSRVLVERPDGQAVGEIVQRNAIGKIDFAMMAGDREVGAIRGESWWQWRFQIVDHTGAEVARVDKLEESLASALFTTADNYALRIHRPLAEPLLSLVVASALTIDTALKQDDR